jgi:uncharacterized coiled-coil protein SlyX
MDEREARIIELETRLAFQERAQGQLDELVRELFGRLERLQREVAELRARAGEGPAPAGPAPGFADGLLDED